MANIYIPISIQREIISLSNDYCEYCWYPAAFSSHSFHFDHIDPLANGGLTILENLARACGGCNGFKQDKIHYFDPFTHQSCRLYHPRQDKWDDHFQWSIDELQLVGKTAIGNTTIALLQLNRSNAINLRKLLKMVGLHPPKL